VLAEVAAAGRCSHPIVLSGETVDTKTGEIRRSVLRIACKDRRSAVCPSCSYLYKTDAWILISSGLAGGKGLPAGLGDHPKLFVTLTAPSFGAVHRTGEHGDCHAHARATSCRHGRPQRCTARHTDGDPDLGTPMCEACFDYEGAVLWNASASALWNRTIVRLRQTVAAAQGQTDRQLVQVARLNYLKVAEFQRRGLVHFHVVVRADGPDGLDPPPGWLTAELLATRLRDLVRGVVLLAPSGLSVSWGSQLSILDLGIGQEENLKVASYLAKYATKSTDGSVALARRFTERRQIERARIAEHPRRLALTAWDLGGDPDLAELGLQRHAHAFGFRGQLLTKSRGFSTTFWRLRRARADHMASFADPRLASLGNLLYTGRGYSDPRGESVAELLHETTVDLHRQRRERRVASADGSRGDSRLHSRDGSRDSRTRSRADRERSAKPQ
jgi:hypothetical protein